ncbi:hypothetical protein IGI04_015423 [Brassica rapa subsp. trilocularis]|uniref:Uncharacterized protein n=1 Tax=Brassica rapa subsp. trilocularis TaxID=1813537 RepID=A0ABQ7MQ03_BRACM|nr:hypothetical protein IGI04_015423 [Brassica rapa subsp. trilocularis]
MIVKVEIYEDLTSLKQPLEKKPTKREEGLTNVPTIRHHPKEAEVRSSPTSSASTVRPGPLAISDPLATRLMASAVRPGQIRNISAMHSRSVLVALSSEPWLHCPLFSPGLELYLKTYDKNHED